MSGRLTRPGPAMPLGQALIDVDRWLPVHGGACNHGARVMPVAARRLFPGEGPASGSTSISDSISVKSTFSPLPYSTLTSIGSPYLLL